MSWQDPSSLSGRIALVTGGSRGIGKATAIRLAQKGAAKIAITYVTNVTGAEEVVSALSAISTVQKATAIHADVHDPEFGPKLIKDVLAKLETHTIDILINNADHHSPDTFEPITRVTMRNFDKSMHANVFSVIQLTNCVLPYLPESGGRIINISSGAAKLSDVDPIAVHGASKAALEAITRSYACILAPDKKCTFNSVSVGLTSTEAILSVKDTFPQDKFQQVMDTTTAAHRMGTPEDIANIIGFLASGEAGWINGNLIPANGGIKLLLSAQG